MDYSPFRQTFELGVFIGLSKVCLKGESSIILYLLDLIEASRGFLNTSCMIVKVLQYSLSVLSISCAITERVSPNDNLPVRVELCKKANEDQ